MSRKVLVLDDDLQIVEALGIILRSSGYTVQMETDAYGIMDKVEASMPDAMIIDIRLQNVNGLDITHDLKTNTNTKHIPIILISARVGELKADQLNGAELYLSKPFRMRELLDSVEKVIAQSSH